MLVDIKVYIAGKEVIINDVDLGYESDELLKFDEDGLISNSYDGKNDCLMDSIVNDILYVEFELYKNGRLK